MTKTARALDLLRANPRISNREIQRSTGLTPGSIRNVRSRFNHDRAHPKVSPQADHPPAGEISFEEKGAEGIASSRSSRIQTLDQLLAAAKVDLTVWDVERHIINKWEVAMKEESKTGKVTPIVEPLVQIKAWLKRRPAQIIGLCGALAAQIADAAKHPPRPSPVRYQKHRGECLAELDIPDLHYGKLCWAAEAGEDMDVAIAERNFKEAVARLRDGALPFGVDRFLFPLGNDFLNVDNDAGETNAGTPQDEDGRWQRTFTNARRLCVWAIDYLREKAPVDVLVVRGNHDWQRTFYLGDTLASWYRLQKDVAIDNVAPGRKYYAWGNTLLGFTHGDKEPVRELPLTMAIERPELWARAKYREFHLGHLHHKRVRDFQPVLEQKSVVVRHLSSLTAADAWHAEKGYRSQRAAQAFIWSKSRGCLAELTYNL
jgi:hypothetical protein